ncbi:MAG: hypothetical protein HY459_01700 [Parcubacteria group bacterium]|nr:hypothetical protein [Parcubacteria group bacterium]
MQISVYQHSASDFKVAWQTEDGRREEVHTMFDLGGAISFALGLKCAALGRGEPTLLSFNLKDPLMNRGFFEGFRRGCKDPRVRQDGSGYTFHERTRSPVPQFSGTTNASLCQVIRESVH